MRIPIPATIRNLAVLAGGLALVSAAPVAAQDIVVFGGAAEAGAEASGAEASDDDDAFEKRMREFGQGVRERMIGDMDIMLEDIDRSARLDDGQRRKLEIAAKGAVDRVIDDWLAGILGNPDLAMQISQMEDAAVGQTLAAWGMSLDSHQAEQHELWSQAVERVLNDDQRQLVAAELQRRNAHDRRLAIERLVVTIDKTLRLSEEQREAVGQMFLDALPEDFGVVNQGAHMQGFGQQAMMIQWHGVPQGMAGGQSLESIDDKAMAQILTATQMKRWQRTKVELNAGAQHGGAWFHNGGGIIQINGGIIHLNDFIEE